VVTTVGGGEHHPHHELSRPCSSFLAPSKQSNGKLPITGQGTLVGMTTHLMDVGIAAAVRGARVVITVGF
jgi:hypothetical protein